MFCLCFLTKIIIGLIFKSLLAIVQAMLLFFAPAFLCIYYLLIFIRYRNKTKKTPKQQIKKRFFLVSLRFVTLE